MRRRWFLLGIRLFPVWCVLVLTAGLLGGCGAKQHQEEVSYGTEEKMEEIELDYYIWDDEVVYTKRVVDSFNAIRPDIHVNIHEIKNEIYDDSIKEVIRNGEHADVIGIRGITKIMDYQRDGLLIELTDDLLRSDLDLTAYGNMVYSYTIDDKYYGLPTRSTYWVLYYNKSLFDQAGIPYPDQMTWEEYAQLAKRFTGGGEGEDRIWGGYFTNWVYYFAGIQRQNYLNDDDITETMESLLWLNRFFNEDKSHVPLSEVIEIGDHYIDVFEKGKIAMMPQGEWVAGRLHTDEEEGNTSLDWDIAPMPIFEKQEKYTTWGQYQFAGITVGCEHPDEAFEFLTYLCGEEGAKIYAGSGMISAYSNDEIIDIYRRNMKGKNVDVFFKSQRIQEFPPVAEYNELVQALKEVSESYLLGQISYEEAVQGMEKKRQEIYQSSAKA